MTVSDNRGAWYVKAWTAGTTSGSSKWYRRGVSGDQVVKASVAGLQRLLHEAGSDPGVIDGLFGARTEAATFASQRTAGLTPDGLVGPATMRWLVKPVVRQQENKHSLEGGVLGGQIVYEAAVDPGAVGVNGFDTGMCQINLDAHRDITVAQACDPLFAVPWSAKRMASAYEQYRREITTRGHNVDPWDPAVLQHNWPAGALWWARNGRPPTSSTMDARAVVVASGLKTWAQYYVFKVRSSAL